MSDAKLKSDTAPVFRAERGQDRDGGRAWFVVIDGWPARYWPRFYYELSAVTRSCACAARAHGQIAHAPFSERRAEFLARNTVMLLAFEQWRRDQAMDRLAEAVEQVAERSAEHPPVSPPSRGDGFENTPRVPASRGDGGQDRGAHAPTGRWSSQVCSADAGWERRDLHRDGEPCVVRVWVHSQQAPDGTIDAIVDALNGLDDTDGDPEGRRDG